MTTADVHRLSVSLSADRTNPLNQVTQCSLPIIHSDTSTFTIMIDENFFLEHHDIGSDPAYWNPPFFRVFRPETGPNVRVFLYLPEHSSMFRFVACQFPIVDYDALTATRLLKIRHNEWVDEITMRFGLSCMAYEDHLIARHLSKEHTPSAPCSPLISVSASPSLQEQQQQQPKTTLLSLLIKLGQPEITSPDQRKIIRRIISDYLNNEISSKRLLSFLVQVVGWHTMCFVLQSSQASSSSTIETAAETAMMKQSVSNDISEHSSTLFGLGHPESSNSFVTHEMYRLPRFEVTPQHTALFVKYFIQYISWFLPEILWTNKRIFGERIVALGNKAFVMGGIYQHKNKDNPEDFVPTFQEFQLLDLSHLTIKKMVPCLCFQTCPPSLMYHVMHIGVFSSGPVILVHGGLHLGAQTTSFMAGKGDQVELNDRLFAFNITLNRWTLLDSNSPQRPSPRHSHCSALYPPTENATPKYLLIYGGIGKEDWKTYFTFHTEVSPVFPAFCVLNPVISDDLKPLNDLWIFNFETGLWSCIMLKSCPSPRFGASFVWATVDTLLLSGGETRHEFLALNHPEINHVRLRGYPPGTPVLLNECWSLVCPDYEIEKDDLKYLNFVWTQLDSLPCQIAHYAAVSLTFCLRPTKADCRIFQGINHVMTPQQTQDCSPTLQPLMKSGWIFRQVIFLISGTTVMCNTLKEIPLIFLGFVNVSSNNSVQVKWLEIDAPTISNEGNSFTARRGHSALFFYALKEDDSEKLLREDIQQCRLFQNSTSHTILDETFVEDSLSFSSQSLTPQRLPCILISRGFQGDRQHTIPPAVLNLSKFYPNFFSAVRKMTLYYQIVANLLLFGPQLFACLPHLVDSESDTLEENGTNDAQNTRRSTLAYSTGASQKSIQKLSGFYENLMHLSPFKSPHCIGGFSDNLFTCLKGFCNHVFSAFGHLLENAANPRLQATSIHVQFHRWRDTQAITVTDDGVGLSHETLHCLLKCYGKKSENFSYYDPAQFGMGFKFALSLLSENCLVLTKTPWKVGVGLLSRSLQALFPGSRFSIPIIFWSTLTGVPLTLHFQEADVIRNLHLLFTNSPLHNMSSLNEEFEGFGKGTRMIFWNLHQETPRLQKNGRIMLSSMFSGDSLAQPQAFHLQPEFPFFSSPQDTLDHNLATYMFWVNLHCAPMLTVNDIPLLPSSSELTKATLDMGESQQGDFFHFNNDAADEKSIHVLSPSGVELRSTNRYANSLWVFLHKRLYHKLELPYLFCPQDGDQNGYALIGFINDPESNETATLYETGILLYYNGRLVNRAIHPIPSYCFKRSSNVFSYTLTAIINVPDFFFPRATKEDFVYEGDLALDDFYDQLEEILNLYLEVHNYKEKLLQLQQDYIDRFDAYREMTWTKLTNSHSIVKSIHTLSQECSRDMCESLDDETMTERLEKDQETASDEHSTPSSDPSLRVWPKRTRRLIEATQRKTPGVTVTDTK